MDQTPGHDYDSFVVRLWRDVNTRSLLRAEVEHVQSGNVGASLDATWDWLTERLRAGALTDGQHNHAEPSSRAGPRPPAPGPSRPVL